MSLISGLIFNGDEAAERRWFSYGKFSPYALLEQLKCAYIGREMGRAKDN